ncbi:DEAD/DEAH box helicase [Iamia sp. SCSIO 61187]|uniref:DEAD/DEAH box helicase n=1 Tax=Iamia sp. SCSIO 61187 TaxID=2722752 RepID=UPI001C632CCD|nr:DEAD/DEAH box helicase [Iamia sp. SCSIO 61187]QYG91165.1 DEAD/DEAH box helicase [Iamia sp. SCSIO 61187]
MNEDVEMVLRQVLQPPAIDEAFADARDAWTRVQFGLNVKWSLPEAVVTIAHQVALFSADIPPILNEVPTDLRIRLEALASTIDIAARLTPDRTRELSKLAAALYLGALQPTRALRSARSLRSIPGLEPSLIRAHRILEGAYRLNGAQTVDAVVAAASREWLGDTGAGLDQVLAAALSDPATFRLLREAEFALRYRTQHDLLQLAADRVPPEYVDRAYGGPPWARRQELLPSQAAAVGAGLLDSLRAFVSTPTGTGKTFLAELRIAREMATNPASLTVYVAPLNALARQVHRDFQRRLSSICAVTLWTGAYELDESVADLGNVLVTTPEKFDSILRLSLSADERSLDLLERLSLVIADEAHQVADGPRGLLYEFLLMRAMRRRPDVAVLALSAVQTDPDPLVRFLEHEANPARLHEVDWSATSVWDVLWAKNGDLVARGDLRTPPRLPRPKQTKAAAALAAATLVERLESVLLVESRRDWAESLAAELYGQYREYLDRRLSENLTSESDRAELEGLADEVEARLYPGHPLAAYVRVGLAVHHAGMPPTIRRRVEELARREVLHTLVATTTLAEGVDLPFRAVVLCRLALPFGQPFRASRIRNIRGRAARPGFASDGLFIVLEPENTNSAAHQYFVDHYWDGTVEAIDSPSALADLFSNEPIRRAPVIRRLESQLLAYYSENEVNLEDAGNVGAQTIFARSVGSGSHEASRLAAGIQRMTERMLEPPALLRVASPITPTPFGRGAILGGLSAASALLIRETLLMRAEAMVELIGSEGSAELAIRLGWLPWEAVETTDEYRDALSRRRPFERTAARLVALRDPRLSEIYDMSRLLISRRLLPELAENEEKVVRGRTSDDRLARLVEWGGRAASILPWTLTGVLRVAESLSEENDLIAQASAAVAPYVVQFSAWVPSPGGAELVRRGVLERDAALALLSASDLWDESSAHIVEWARDNSEVATELVGSRAYSSLVRNSPNEADFGDEEGGDD